MERNDNEREWQEVRQGVFQLLVEAQLSKRRLSDYNWIFNKFESKTQQVDLLPVEVDLFCRAEGLVESESTHGSLTFTSKTAVRPMLTMLALI